MKRLIRLLSFFSWLTYLRLSTIGVLKQMAPDRTRLDNVQSTWADGKIRNKADLVVAIVNAIAMRSRALALTLSAVH